MKVACAMTGIRGNREKKTKDKTDRLGPTCTPCRRSLHHGKTITFYDLGTVERGLHSLIRCS